MSYFHLLLVTTLAMAIGTAVLWFLSRSMRFRIIKRGLALWIDMLWIWMIAVLILYTHPLQNWFWVLLCSGIVYAIVNFLVGTGSVGTLLAGIRLPNKHAINPRRRVLIILLYIVATLAMTPGQSMLAGFDHATSDSNILLSIQGSMAVDIHGVGTYDLVISDTDHNFVIDTILYDVNKDGKVDLIIDQAPDGTLSREGVSTSRQLRILVLLTVVIVLISMLWYYSWKERKRYLHRQQKKQQQYMVQMMSRGAVLLIAFGQTSSTRAMSIPQAQQGLVSHTDCVRDPMSISACDGVTTELKVLFSLLKDKKNLSEFSMFSDLYLQCKVDQCSSQRYHEIDNAFTKWWNSRTEVKIQQKLLLEVGSTDQHSDMFTIQVKKAAFERVIKVTIADIETHKRWLNFQTELAATNYMTQQTMNQLELELEPWRQQQLGNLDWMIKEFMLEINQASKVHHQSFEHWLDEQDPHPKLARQLLSLHTLHRSMYRSELYKKVSQQNINQEIDPYILYTAIRLGEHLFQANPWDSTLFVGQELLGNLNMIPYQETKPARARYTVVNSYLSVIAQEDLKTLDSTFQQAWINMIRSRDNPENTVRQKGKAFGYAFAKSLQIGWEIVLHESLFMSTSYMLERQKLVQQLNTSYFYR